MNAQYTKHAHRKSVFQQLQRYLNEHFLDAENPASKYIISEEVLVKDRVVTQEVLMDVLDVLQRLESLEHREMTSYELKKREPAEVDLEKALTKEET